MQFLSIFTKVLLKFERKDHFSQILFSVIKWKWKSLREKKYLKTQKYQFWRKKFWNSRLGRVQFIDFQGGYTPPALSWETIFINKASKICNYFVSNVKWYVLKSPKYALILIYVILCTYICNYMHLFLLNFHAFNDIRSEGHNNFWLWGGLRLRNSMIYYNFAALREIFKIFVGGGVVPLSPFVGFANIRS